MLGPLPVGVADVSTREQVLVHPNRPVIFTPTAEQVAQRKVQLGGVRVVLHRLNESVDGLVLLLVEQVIQPFEIRARCLSVSDAHLAQVQTRGDPAQCKCCGQAQQNPRQVKLHQSPRVLALGLQAVCFF